jgi:hypothetical protein
MRKLVMVCYGVLKNCAPFERDWTQKIPMTTRYLVLGAIRASKPKLHRRWSLSAVGKATRSVSTQANPKDEPSCHSSCK